MLLSYSRFRTDTLKTQLNKLDMLHDDMEKAQERIRDKVERQIPQDVWLYLSGAIQRWFHIFVDPH